MCKQEEEMKKCENWEKANTRRGDLLPKLQTHHHGKKFYQNFIIKMRDSSDSIMNRMGGNESLFEHFQI